MICWNAPASLCRVLRQAGPAWPTLWLGSNCLTSFLVPYFIHIEHYIVHIKGVRIWGIRTIILGWKCISVRCICCAIKSTHARCHPVIDLSINNTYKQDHLNWVNPTTMKCIMGFIAVYYVCSALWGTKVLGWRNPFPVSTMYVMCAGLTVETEESLVALRTPPII